MATPHTYSRPRTLAEAIEQARAADLAIAGGTLTLGGVLVPYAHVVDLQDVPELRRLQADTNGIIAGAALPLAALADHPAAPAAVRRALTRAIPPHIRAGTSIGESLLQRNHPLLREWITVAAAHDIGVELITLATGETRWMNLTRLLDDGWPTATLISALHLPVLRAGEALGLAHVARTPSDVPIVCAAAFMRLSETGTVETAFGAVCGASRRLVVVLPLDALRGQPLHEGSINAALMSIPREVFDAEGDDQGSGEYRREMAVVCLRRAVAFNNM